MKLPTPKQIFNEIVEGTPNFNAKCYEDDTACTSGVFSLFKMLGESLGYTVMPKVSRKGEFLTLDLLWKKGEDIVLAMEHENDTSSDPIEDEWRKLVNVKAVVKVLISYKSDPIERRKWIRRAGQLIKSNSLKLPNEVYLLILGCYGEGKTGKDPYIRYNAFVFDNIGNKKDEYHSPTIPMNMHVHGT